MAQQRSCVRERLLSGFGLFVNLQVRYRALLLNGSSRDGWKNISFFLCSLYRKVDSLAKQTALNDTIFVPQLEALTQKNCYLVLPRGRYIRAVHWRAQVPYINIQALQFITCRQLQHVNVHLSSIFQEQQKNYSQYDNIYKRVYAARFAYLRPSLCIQSCCSCAVLWHEALSLLSRMFDICTL